MSGRAYTEFAAAMFELNKIESQRDKNAGIKRDPNQILVVATARRLSRYPRDGNRKTLSRIACQGEPSS